ncbi:MAG: Gldg family protein [Ignavibacteriae bacterium]|nr:Gldg family protein [Ignavibacteriota bacterium]
MKHINIIFKKELRSYFDSPVAYIYIIIFLLLNGSYFVSNLFLENVASLRLLFESTPWLLLFFASAITMRLIAEERKSGTYETLNTKPIKVGEIVMGKFLAAWFLILVALLPTLLYLFTVWLLGNIDIGPVFGGYFGLMLLGGAFIAIGMLGSAMSENQIVSFIISFVIILILFTIDKILIYLPLNVVSAVEYLGVVNHYASVARGVLDSRDIVYYLTVMIFSLLLATSFAHKESIRNVWRLKSFDWKREVPKLGLVLVILVFFNLLSFRIFYRVDLTREKLYTLTPTTKSLLNYLDDNFLVKAYFTPNLPPPYHNHKRIVQEQLDEFRAHSPQAFHYQFIPVADDPDAEREAISEGMEPVQTKVIKDDQYQTQKGYAGLVFSYGDKSERLPVVEQLDHLEYYITRNMKKLLVPQAHKIGILTGHGETSPEKMNAFRKELSKQYQIRTVNLSGGNKAVPEDISILLIVSPKNRFSEKDKYQLNNYVMRGGKLAMFINTVVVDSLTHRSSVIDLNLGDMIENWGCALGTDLLLDATCVTITAKVDTLATALPTDVAYPFYPLTGKFNQSNIAFKNLQPVAFTFVSTVDPKIASIRGVSGDALLTTSNRTTRMEGEQIDTDPAQIFPEDMFTLEDIPVAAALEGQFKSMYTLNRAVELKIIKEDEADYEDPIPARSQNTRIVIIGDGDFVLDAAQYGQQNIEFASTAVDWLVDDIELASMKMRDPSPKQFTDVSEGTKTFVKYFNFTAPPALIILIGFLRLMMNAARRKRHKSY